MWRDVYLPLWEHPRNSQFPPPLFPPYVSLVSRRCPRIEQIRAEFNGPARTNGSESATDLRLQSCGFKRLFVYRSCIERERRSDLRSIRERGGREQKTELYPLIKLSFVQTPFSEGDDRKKVSQPRFNGRFNRGEIGEEYKRDSVSRGGIVPSIGNDSERI